MYNSLEFICKHPMAFATYLCIIRSNFIPLAHGAILNNIHRRSLTKSWLKFMSCMTQLCFFSLFSFNRANYILRLQHKRQLNWNAEINSRKQSKFCQTSVRRNCFFNFHSLFMHFLWGKLCNHLFLWHLNLAINIRSFQLVSWTLNYCWLIMKSE